MIGSSTQPFAKTLCSICYEDLKPIVEDLQAISICGHVFHELCIQQWFEYCSKGKKKCPICKQTCSASNVSRLYFKSVGDLNDPNLSQKLQNHKDPEELKLEVGRLERRISGLSVALESRENELINLKEEFSVCTEQLKKEESLRKEAMDEYKTINSLLELKKRQLEESEQKRSKLEERHKALAKELAALKLVSDTDLEDDKTSNLASLGTEPHSKETVDRLVKSLIVHNKKHKELMTKYKILETDAACSCKELEELMTKYKNLETDAACSCKELEETKKKVKDLETLKEKLQKMQNSKEMKDSEVSRALKASKKTKYSPWVLNGVDRTLNGTCTLQDAIKEPDVYTRKTKRSRGTENIIKSTNKDDTNPYIIIDDDAHTPKVSMSPESPSYESVLQPTNGAITNDDVVFVHKTGQNKPLPDITNVAPLPALRSQKADFCFNPGLLGPDGTKSYLGKWCKRGQNKGSNASSISTQSSGDANALGADGRAGTTKVLNSQKLPSNDSKGSFFSAKSSKLGARTSSLQFEGGLQIGHFLVKQVNSG